jgi:hypothetical protein
MTETFWMFLITSSIGFIIAVSKMCYKSKCKEVDICCIKVIRDTNLEEKELEFETIHNVKEDDSNKASQKV